MKILLVKTSSLGDIIHTFPVVSYLQQHYPQATIDWVVEAPFAELVKGHPGIHRVFSVHTKRWRKQWTKKETWREIKGFVSDLRAQKYDIAFDLQGNIKSGWITGWSKGALKVGFGRSTVPEWPNVLFTNQRYNPPKGQNIRQDYLFVVQSVLGNFPVEEEGVVLRISPSEQVQVRQILEHPCLQAKHKMVVCPGSNWINKQLPLSSLTEFLRLIAQEYPSSFLFAWGSAEERKAAEALAQAFPEQSMVLDKLSLPVLQNLMSQMNLVIAMDSLPLHLAGTTSTPTYSIFGPSLAEKYKPNGKRHQSFQGSCPYGKVFDKRCPILRTCTTGHCINDITALNLFKDFRLFYIAL